MTVRFTKKFSFQKLSSPEDQAKGFQHASPEEIQGKVLWFHYDDDQVRSFHMHNVQAPLDIAFLDANNKIIEIKTMQPEDTLHQSTQPARHAIEAYRGFFQDNSLNVGDTFDPASS